MDETKQKIISLFKNKLELSTAEIISELLPEYGLLKQKIDISSKRKLAQAHRKILYHINELVKNSVLRFTHFGEKGLKFFTLDLSEGEQITEFSTKYKKKIIASRPIMPTLPIESYENQVIVLKFEPETWIDKLNSIVIMCEKIPNIDNLEKIFEKALEIVNDSICLENFEKILEQSTSEDIIKFLEKINYQCNDCRKKVSCIIDLGHMKRTNFPEILEKTINSKNILFIYDLNAEEVQEHFGILSDILTIYINNKSIIYIKNKRLQKSTYYLGTAGPYCFSDKERPEKENCLTIACAQSSLIVDVEKFYSLYGLDIEKFSQLMINISKSFLSANSLQRRKSQEYFQNLISLDKKNEKEFLEFSKNYIRFWNFGLLQPGLDQKLVLNMISEAKKKIDQFSASEETIYKCCGMPTRFKIALSCAFHTSVKKLSEAKYKPLEINNIDELYKPKTKKEIIDKEQVTSLFDGGNDITFHRGGNFNSADVVREISVIMNTYKMPLFSYNFKNIKGDSKISSYL